MQHLTVSRGRVKVASIIKSEKHKQIQRNPWNVRKTGEFAISGEWRARKWGGRWKWATSPMRLQHGWALPAPSQHTQELSRLVLKTLQRAVEELGWKRDPQNLRGWHSSLLAHQNCERCWDKPSLSQLRVLKSSQAFSNDLFGGLFALLQQRGLTWGCKCGPWHGSVYPDLGGSINFINFCLPWEWAQGSLWVPPRALECPFCALHTVVGHGLETSGVVIFHQEDGF